MVLQCAIQMSDIRKTLKNCQMKIAYLFSPMSKKCSHLNYIFSSSDVSLSPYMFERHYIAP